MEAAEARVTVAGGMAKDDAVEAAAADGGILLELLDMLVLANVSGNFCRFIR